MGLRSEDEREEDDGGSLGLLRPSADDHEIAAVHATIAAEKQVGAGRASWTIEYGRAELQGPTLPAHEARLGFAQPRLWGLVRGVGNGDFVWAVYPTPFSVISGRATSLPEGQAAAQSALEAHAMHILALVGKGSAT